jgi:hypothetical protein
MAYLVVWVPQWVKLNTEFWAGQELKRYIDSVEA